MQVLLLGGNAALRRSIIKSLLRDNHRISVRSGDAHELASEWPGQVHDDSSPAPGWDSICDVVVVIHPSVTPRADGSPDSSSEANEGMAAARGRRVISIVPRGEPPADAGLTIRTGMVYGIVNDPVTLFLIMMRSLPAVPMLSETHALQPLWHEDLARAVAAAVAMTDEQGTATVDVAGPETVTLTQLYERIATMIGRRPVRIPVPDFIAAHGSRLAEALRLPSPFSPTHLALARAENAIPPEANGLSRTFGVTATTLDEGLRRLANELEEVTPFEGVGTLEVKRFAADIRQSPYDAVALLRLFRSRFKDVMPVEIGVEPGSPQTELEQGAVISMRLPGRGNVQVRVEEVTAQHVVVATLRGHALAGIVRFRCEEIDGGLRFEVMTCDAAANALDWLTLTLGGARIQDANWTRVVHNAVKLSEGSSTGVTSDARKLEPEEARHVQQWIEKIIQRQRSARVQAPAPPQVLG